ncbi:hypothetical protein MML48_2g00009471 [Holotrichia oblita]|uniref:Uncharacterized protein n=1 Tax=Holotrichia oblita TaxID=644536 RepID=A0ACB9TKJ1_HOLOL|nr:hypothetical protein MML48_2g00009471 [Holotrichia oblita]
MSEETPVEDNVKTFIDNIVKKYNLDTDAKIAYNRGSEIGDGFMSKTYAVDINDTKESLHLFLKCALNLTFPEGTGFDQIYTNEIHFYERFVPTYMEFLKEKGITDGFRNVPKCYGTADNKILALQNLKKDGYELCDKVLIGNDQHIELVFKTYAKFHAVGFAYKDQRPDLYNKLMEGVTDLIRGTNEEFNRQRMEGSKVVIDEFFKKLDPRRDKFIVDQTQHILDKLTEFGLNFGEDTSPNPILIQGDCWCNNMMFKYITSKEYPEDVMLLDWQAIRSGSPTFDLSYFFYTTAPVSKKTLKRVDDFLEIYHEELSKQIKQLGSNPDKLYPLSDLKKEWHRYAKFGFCMAFMILKAMLGKKEEMPNFDGTDMTEALRDGKFFNNVSNDDEYMRRMRNLAEHFLLNEFL